MVSATSIAADGEIATSCVALLATKGGVLVIAREPQAKVVERANDVALDRRHSDGIAAAIWVYVGPSPLFSRNISRVLAGGSSNIRAKR